MINLYDQMNEYKVKFKTSIKPMIKWKIFRQCNFKCHYCNSWEDSKQDLSVSDAEKLAHLMIKFVPRAWRIYLTGGELTINMKFLLSLIKTIAKVGNEIRLISNMSAQVEDYLALEEISHGCLKSYFITYHPTMMPENIFIDKIMKLRKFLPSSFEICIRQVILPNLSSFRQFLELKHIFKESNLVIHPLRLLRKKDQKYTNPNYNKLSQSLTQKVFRDIPNFPKRKGTVCPAGFEFIYVDPKLNVYPCIPYKNQQNSLMGNLRLENVSLKKNPMICNLDFCSCVPGR